MLLRWRDLVLETDPDIIIGCGAVALCCAASCMMLPDEQTSRYDTAGTRVTCRRCSWQTVLTRVNGFRCRAAC